MSRARGAPVSAALWLGGLIALGLAGYLLYALFNPDRF